MDDDNNNDGDDKNGDDGDIDDNEENNDYTVCDNGYSDIVGETFNEFIKSNGKDDVTNNDIDGHLC